MRVESIRATAYQVPTDLPEADGTLAWDSTTMVLVEATSDSGETGLGYTYSSVAAALLELDGDAVRCLEWSELSTGTRMRWYSVSCKRCCSKNVIRL